MAAARFSAAASYAGFEGGGAAARFKDDVALLLFGLYQQATVGPCNTPKPSSRNSVEHSRWMSWHGLGNMAPTEAKRLFVKILEEEEPAWYSRAAPTSFAEPVTDVETHKPKQESSTPKRNLSPEPKYVSMEYGGGLETQDKDVIMEGLGAITSYDQWVMLSVSGQRPKPRYQHGAVLLQERMYIFGGNYNGRYRNDLQVLDLRSLTWSNVEAKVDTGTAELTSEPVAPCAGHSMISWGNKILSIAGHTKDFCETVTVKEFDLQTYAWSNLKTYGKAPISRGGQSVTLVGSSLVLFGGETAKRSLLNDLHILDLESMTWSEVNTVGALPPPRSDHAAACHAERYLLIFGGSSHTTCLSDLHVLDLKSMEWSRPKQEGVAPAPRAGHAGITVGETWFIVGGGNNKNGISETLALNMSTFVWTIITTVQGSTPLASEGLSLVMSSYNGENILLSFGGYNGRYNNEVYVLKPSNKSHVPSKMIEKPDSTGASRPMEPEIETFQDARTREIKIDNVNSKPLDVKNVQTNDQVVTTLKAEKEQLVATLAREQLQISQLKNELVDAEGRNAELTKELQSVCSQLAVEQSRCFKLEVEVAELQRKLQMMDTLQKELELLQRQKAASEQAALSANRSQGSGGVWRWLAGTSPDKSES